MKTSVKKNKLCVVVFLDGRPGHEKQSKGILQALQAKIEIETREIVVKKMFPFALLKFILHFFHLGSIKDLSWSVFDGADMLLGTGSKTHLPMLFCKKRYGIPAVTCMSPNIFFRDSFDLCFVPVHDGLAERGNVVHTVGAPNCSTDQGQHNDASGLVLLGGVDAKSHNWDSDEIAGMVRQIVTRETTKHWTISSSPRTPAAMADLMEGLCLEFSHVRFFDYRKTEPGWIESQYAKSGYVWVTSDSISMVYEALSAGCKVGVLPMRWRDGNSKFKRNEDILLQKGLVVSFFAWKQGTATWSENIGLNEAHRCAERILEKWWPKN